VEVRKRGRRRCSRNIRVLSAFPRSRLAGGCLHVAYLVGATPDRSDFRTWNLGLLDISGLGVLIVGRLLVAVACCERR
jgi:hypothetical protein